MAKLHLLLLSISVLVCTLFFNEKLYIKPNKEERLIVKPTIVLDCTSHKLSPTLNGMKTTNNIF